MILSGTIGSGTPEGWFVSNAAGTTEAAPVVGLTSGSSGDPAVYGTVNSTASLRKRLPVLGEMSVTATVKTRSSSAASGGVIARLMNGGTMIAQAPSTGSPTSWQNLTVTGLIPASATAPAIALITIGSSSSVFVDEWSVTMAPSFEVPSINGGFNWGDSLDWTFSDATASWASRKSSVVTPAMSASGGRAGYAASTMATSGGAPVASIMRPVKIIADQSNVYEIWANAASAGLGNFRARLYSDTGAVIAEQPITASAGYQRVTLQYAASVTENGFISFEHGVDGSGTGSVLWDDWFVGVGASTRTYVRQGGLWLPATRSVRQGGVWVSASMHIRQSGVWQQV